VGSEDSSKSTSAYLVKNVILSESALAADCEDPCKNLKSKIWLGTPRAIAFYCLTCLTVTETFTGRHRLPDRFWLVAYWATRLSTDCDCSSDKARM